MDDTLSESVIGAAIEVHRHLGPGLLESVYEEGRCIELALGGIPSCRPAEVEVIYKEHRIKGLNVDLLVDSALIVELKSVSQLPDVATAQVLSYLGATQLKRALLLNFGQPRLVDGIKHLSL